MALTNDNLPVIDLPSWEIIQPLPAASAIGVCLCNDKRGTDDWMYLLISATSFWRYSARANTYQQLASPPGGTVGAGTALIYDPANAYVWALISSGTGAPTWQYYDTATNTWTARSVVNLPGTFGTDAALSFPAVAYHASGNDDFIYLIGNAATVFYRFQISTNTWVATLTAVTAAPGAGCALFYSPIYNPGKLVCLRGGASATVYAYDIVGNSWATLTIIPATETFTTGTQIASRGMLTSKVYIQHNTTLRIYELDLSTLKITPAATEYLIASGAAHVGDRFLYVRTTDGIEYLYLGLHTSANFLRTGLVF